MLFFSPEELWRRLEELLPREGAGMVREAYAVAYAAHAGQTRHEGTPYIVHPLRVALLLASRRDLAPAAPLLAAALLHDVVEDTGVTLETIRARFGDEVGGWVAVLTKPARETRTPDWEDRYYQAIMAAPWPARLIKLADRLDNLAGLFLRPADKQVKYRAETRAHLLPLAAATDPTWEEEMRRLLVVVE